MTRLRERASHAGLSIAPVKYSQTCMTKSDESLRERLNERTMNLEKLAEPFPIEDIEWRVSRSGVSSNGIYCRVLAYITARAIQKRLDEVCGPENWRNEPPQVIAVNGKSAFSGGISIRHQDEWITKWDVSEPTNVPNIDPAKGGFSGAMKRAGAQWGVGRYLYYLSETRAEVSSKKLQTWNWAKLSEKQGGTEFWWKTPSLPGWALPKDPDHEISADELNQLKAAWRGKFAENVKNPTELREGFSRFIETVAGEFPHGDYTCWTRDALERCEKRIVETTEPNGVDSDVPFEGAS